MENIIYQDSQRFKGETDDLALSAGKVRPRLAQFSAELIYYLTPYIAYVTISI